MAVTLLVGVDAILRASPSGQTMTLSPWSLGGGGGEGGDTAADRVASSWRRLRLARGRTAGRAGETEGRPRAESILRWAGLEQSFRVQEFRSENAG